MSDDEFKPLTETQINEFLAEHLRKRMNVIVGAKAFCVKYGAEKLLNSDEINAFRLMNEYEEICNIPFLAPMFNPMIIPILTQLIQLGPLCTDLNKWIRDLSLRVAAQKLSSIEIFNHNVELNGLENMLTNEEKRAIELQKKYKDDIFPRLSTITPEDKQELESMLAEVLALPKIYMNATELYVRITQRSTD